MNNVNLRKLMQAQFNEAKKWWTITTLCRLVVVLIGVITIITSLFATWLGLLAALLTVAHVLCQWQSDSLRESAESILRKIELKDGLGWSITGREIADLLLNVSKSVKAQAYTPPQDSYFDSTTAQSSRRMLENLVQSIWFTRHQAQRMVFYVTWISFAVFVVAFVSSVGTLQNAINQTIATNIAKITIAVIVFMFTGGYVRLAVSYSSFARQAERVEQHADRMLQEDTREEIQVIKLLHDYQILRAKAPLLPNWLWNRMEAELNELWHQQKQAKDV